MHAGLTRATSHGAVFAMSDSGLPPAPERLESRSEPTLSFNVGIDRQNIFFKIIILLWSLVKRIRSRHSISHDDFKKFPLFSLFSGLRSWFVLAQVPCLPHVGTKGGMPTMRLLYSAGDVRIGARCAGVTLSCQACGNQPAD